jgi:hypothetical protein
MRICKNEKTEKLCSGFSQLDGKEQEHIFGVLQGLLFAKLKTDSAMILSGAVSQNEGEKELASGKAGKRQITGVPK